MLAITPRAKGFHKEIDSIAPDKSISHRCAMFALLAEAPSVVHNYLLAQDTLHTLEIARKLGLKVEEQSCRGNFIFTPPSKIVEPDSVLDCGNAGTAMRLYTGLLSAQNGYFVLSGDKYLHARPMNRVIKPLQSIGARIYSRSGGYAPLSVVGGELQGFRFTSEITSAQVKSALILAALFAKDSSVYSEREHTRDHTEKMLCGMGAQIAKESKQGLCSITINPLSHKLQPLDIAIPADPSSAFFFAVAAAITPDSSVLLKNVLLNPARIEAFKVLESMGAIIEYRHKACVYEEVGDIYVQSAPLKAVNVSHNISWLIDELPALAIAFCFASGRSEVSNAKELRVKETDRIHAIINNLTALGIVCEEKEDGFGIDGLSNGLESKKVDSSAILLRSFGDHRIAMSFAIMGLRLGVAIDDEMCIGVSFPNFLEILREITEVRLLDY